jgi:hypothetical protein
MRGIWKIAAVATLLIAPTAFGAAKVYFTPTAQGVESPGVATFEVWLELDAGTKVGSLDPFILQTAGPYGTLTVTEITPGADSVLASPTKGGNGNWSGLPYTFTDANSFVDVGGFNLNAEAAITEMVSKVTVVVAGGLPIGTSLTLSAVGVTSGSGTTLTGPVDDLGASATFNIIPEPMSALLIAAGAAFFARRRRA